MISLDSKNHEAYYAKGNTLLEIEKFEEASNCFTKAIELDQKNSSYLICKGVCLKYLNKFNEAIKYFDQAISLKPDDANAHFSKGINHMKLFVWQFLKFNVFLNRQNFIQN